MADQRSTPSGTPSGSRWEPTPGDDQTPDDTGTTERADAVETPETVTPAPHEDPYGVVPPVTPSPVDDADRRARLRGRAVLAGAATALTLGGGLVGFVIGHSTTGDDNGFRPANFSGQQPGGRLGNGQQGPPSFGDRDGDGPGFGQPPQGSDGGSSSNSGSSGTGT